MADRIEIFNTFMTLQMEGKLDDAIAMLADDVVLTDPMSGAASGKAAVEASMRSRPPGAGEMGLTWSEPAIDGDTVTLIGTGSPFGPIRVVVAFNATDKISKIDIGMA
jgi:hypothetical protein